MRHCPIEAAWKDLRGTARSRGFDTNRLGCVGSRTITDRIKPIEMSAAWAARVSANLSHRDRAKFSMELRNIDGMRQDAHLASLLPTEILSAIEDHRKNGNANLPSSVLAEIEQHAQDHGFAHNTLRHVRSTLTKVYTAGLKAGIITLPCRLEDVAAAAAAVHVDWRCKRVANLILARII